MTTLILTEEEARTVFAGLHTITFGSLPRPETVMRGLFSTLREADSLNADRLYRAAGHNVLKVDT